MARKLKKPAPVHFANLQATVVRPPGKRSPHWYWRIRIAGTKQDVWTGRASGDGIGTLMRDIVKRGVNAPADTGGSQCQSVDDLLDFYLGHLKGLPTMNEPTLKLYRSMKRAVKPFIGDVLLDSWDYATQADYVTKRQVSSRTHYMELDLVKRAWTWGARVGLVPDRRIDWLRVQVAPSKDKFTPTGEQIGQVLDTAKGWVRIFLLISWGTGARQNEIATLTWGKVDLDGEHPSVTFFGKRSKKNKHPWRTCYISPALVDELRAWMPDEVDDDTRVLGLTPGSVGSSMSRQLAKLCEQAGVPHFTNHGIRRHVVNKMMRSGIPVAVAAMQTGHTPEVMLRAYRQVAEEEKHALAGLLGAQRGDVIEVEFTSR